MVYQISPSPHRLTKNAICAPEISIQRASICHVQLDDVVSDSLWYRGAGHSAAQSARDRVHFFVAHALNRGASERLCVAQHDWQEVALARAASNDGSKPSAFETTCCVCVWCVYAYLPGKPTWSGQPDRRAARSQSKSRAFPVRSGPGPNRHTAHSAKYCRRRVSSASISTLCSASPGSVRKRAAAFV